MHSSNLSIIIPTLDEIEFLEETITSCRRACPTCEVIVSDGGSGDGTRELADQLDLRLVDAARGRAIQMNQGAEAASRPTLLFLHADTRLPPGFSEVVLTTLQQRDAVAGAFRLRIRGKDRSLRLIEQVVNLRSRYLQMPYGDQALFMSREVFHQVGGFPLQPIMEDFELVRRLKRRGRVVLADLPVLTAGRRWQINGPVHEARFTQESLGRVSISLDGSEVLQAEDVVRMTGGDGETPDGGNGDTGGDGGDGGMFEGNTLAIAAIAFFAARSLD